jgi:hypothetical protein
MGGYVQSKQDVVACNGRPIGEDHWDLLRSGECWRQARFPGWIAAEYGFATEHEASLFD